MTNICRYSIVPEPWCWRHPFSKRVRLRAEIDIASAGVLSAESVHETEADALARLAALVVPSRAAVHRVEP